MLTEASNTPLVVYIYLNIYRHVPHDHLVIFRAKTQVFMESKSGKWGCSFKGDPKMAMDSQINDKLAYKKALTQCWIFSIAATLAGGSQETLPC